MVLGVKRTILLVGVLSTLTLFSSGCDWSNLRLQTPDIAKTGNGHGPNHGGNGLGGSSSTPTPTPTPSLVFSPEAINFGQVAASSSSAGTTVTLSNNAATDATGCTVTIGDTTNFTLIGAAGCATISSGSSCSLTVTGSPHASGVFRTFLSVACAGSNNATSAANGMVVYTGTAAFQYPAPSVEMLVGQATNALTPFDLNSGLYPYTFTLSPSPTLPAGLSFNTTTGSFTGTPTVTSTGTYQVCAPATYSCNAVTIHAVAEQTIAGPLTVDPALCTSVVGTGTNADPIQLSTVSNVDTCVRNYPSRAYKLTADLDFTGVSFEPLPAFTGVFDGQNYSIKNWTYTPSTIYSGYGFFQILDHGSVVKNLQMKNITISASNNDVGALAGQLLGGIVHDVTLLNISVSGASMVASLVGLVANAASSPAFDGYIDHVQATNLTVSSSSGWSHSGFVVGTAVHLPFRISRVAVSGTNSFPTQGNNMGGIIGANYGYEWGGATAGNLWLDQCSTVGASISSNAFTGGLIGNTEGGDTYTNSYSTLSLGGNYGVGEFIGNLTDNPSHRPIYVVDSYFSGTQTGSDQGAIAGAGGYRGFTAGLVLVNTAISNSVTTSLIGDGIGPIVSSSNQFYSDAQFKAPANFNTWLSPPWSFSVGSYPSLP